MRKLTWIIPLFFCLNAFAADMKVDLRTPRGRAIQLDVYNPGKANALLLAPGQGCNPRLDMYNAIAAEGAAQNYTVVRLYWAYCVADPIKGQPSDDLSLESEDFLTAYQYVRSELGFSDGKVWIGGKSLGTFVSQAVFANNKGLAGLVLLTPVCSEKSPGATASRNVFDEYYPGLSQESRPVILAQGNSDILCETTHFQEYLKGKGNHFVSLTTSGDHGFGVKNQAGEYDSELGARNLRAISKWLFSWI